MIWQSHFQLLNQQESRPGSVPELIIGLQKCQSFIFSITRLFVRQNKTCMIRIMTQQVLLNWGNIF